MKKIIALILAMMLVLASVAALAADPAVDTSQLGAPYDGDTRYDTTFVGVADNAISVGGLQEGDKVYFYRVLEYDQDARAALGTAQNAAGWKVTDAFKDGENAVTAADLQAILTTGITSTLAGKIAKNATGTPTINPAVEAGSNGVATANEPGAGLYVAIVEPLNAGFIYNPIFVASDYYKTGTSSASSTWTAVSEALSYSDRAMAKKSPIEITKDAEEPAASEPTNEQKTGDTAYYNGRAAGVGDTITYTVKTTIPMYASNYLNPLFVITDQLSDGLTLDQNSIKVYTATVNEGVYAKVAELTTAGAYDISNKSDRGYKVKFNKDYLLGLTAVQPIWIEYSAVVTEDAITNVNVENNTVTLEYSHKPDVDEEGKGKKVRDKTHHYTWTIDGTILGDSGWKTTEVVKVGLDKDGNEITQTTAIEGHNPFGPLAGAEFKLYTDSGCNTEYDKGAYHDATATTDGNKIVSDAAGRLTLNGTTNGIPGLDAGEYWLKEEKAPAGYIKQQAAVHIEIIPEFYPSVTWTDTDGCEITCTDLLKGYVVKIDGEVTADYTLNYAAMANGKPTNDTLAANETTHDMVTHGDLVIGNAGPIISDTTSSDYSEHDDDGKIKNTQGVELPSTGGIGTTIFYVAGSILVLAAVIFMVTKRRMNANND